MQNEFIENLTKLNQSLIKPITDLTELNADTLNKFVKTEAFKDLLQAKPEEFFTRQSRVVNTATLEIIKHTQEACGILVNATTQTGKIIEEIIRKTTTKSADFAQSSINKTKEKV